MRLPSDRPPATAPVAPATQGSSLTWHTSQEVANVSCCTCTRCWLHRIERGSMVGTGQMCESMVGTTKAQIRRATHDRGERQQWPSRTLRLSDRSPTEAASQMARVWKRRSAAAGRTETSSSHLRGSAGSRPRPTQVGPDLTVAEGSSWGSFPGEPSIQT